MRTALLLVLFISIFCDAATLFVGDDNARFRKDDFKNGYYNDLQTAIDKAGSGDTIRIAPGIFGAKAQPPANR